LLARQPWPRRLAFHSLIVSGAQTGAPPNRRSADGACRRV